MQVVVREAGLEDHEAYLRLYYEFFRELRYRQGWGPHSLGDYSRETRRHLERDTVLLAIDTGSGEPVGFARVSEREGSYWIEEIYVRPEHRGRGVGRRLVEEAEKRILENDSAAYVMVLPQDLDALRFWIRMGYDTLNSVELVKELEETRRSREGKRPFMLQGFLVYTWKWRREEYDEALAGFLEAIEEYARLGWDREELLHALTRAVRSLIEEKRGRSEWKREL